MRSPAAASDLVVDDEPVRPATCGDVRPHLPGSKRQRKSSTETTSSDTVVEPVKRLSTSRAGTPPVTNVFNGPDSLTSRDRFKIQKPDGSWCDAYGRSTSPISTIKRAAPKPAITMRGFLQSRTSFLTPHEVTVSGHFPTGWGRLCLPPTAPANGAYKSTPGDPTPLPGAIADQQYTVTLFFADDLQSPAGTSVHRRAPASTPTTGVSCCRRLVNSEH